MSEDHKLEAIIPADRYDQMGALAHVCGLREPEQVINVAITLFAWMVQQAMHGYQIMAVDQPSKRAEALDADVLNNARAYAAANDMTDIGREG